MPRNPADRPTTEPRTNEAAERLRTVLRPRMFADRSNEVVDGPATLDAALKWEAEAARGAAPLHEPGCILDDRGHDVPCIAEGAAPRAEDPDFESDIALARRHMAAPRAEGLDAEILAALEHEQWAHWTRYMLDNLTPGSEEPR